MVDKKVRCDSRPLAVLTPQQGGKKEHLEAQRKGRKDFYSVYRIQVCTVIKDSAFKLE